MPPAERWGEYSKSMARLKVNRLEGRGGAKSVCGGRREYLCRTESLYREARRLAELGGHQHARLLLDEGVCRTDATDATRQSGVRRQLENCWIDDKSVEADRTAIAGIEY